MQSLHYRLSVLVITLQENRDLRGVGGKGIDRCSKYRGMTTPSANRTKLTHDIEFLQRAPGILTAADGR